MSPFLLFGSSSQRGSVLFFPALLPSVSERLRCRRWGRGHLISATVVQPPRCFLTLPSSSSLRMVIPSSFFFPPPFWCFRLATCRFGCPPSPPLSHPSLSLHPSILPSIISLSPPPAERVTLRHKHPLFLQTLPPSFFFPVCLTLFQSLEPSFFFFFLHQTFSLGTPLLFLSSSVHLVVSVCPFKFSCFPPLLFPASLLRSLDHSYSSFA